MELKEGDIVLAERYTGERNIAKLRSCYAYGYTCREERCKTNGLSAILHDAKRICPEAVTRKANKQEIAQYILESLS